MDYWLTSKSVPVIVTKVDQLERLKLMLVRKKEAFLSKVSHTPK